MAAVALPSRAPWWLRYGVAVTVPLAVLSLREAMEPVLMDRAPLLLPALAIIVAAWLGGLWPGIVCSVATIVVWLLHGGELAQSLAAGKAHAYVRLGMFAALGVGISVLSELLHRSRRRAEDNAASARQAHAALERQVAQLQTLLEIAPVGIAVSHDPHRRLITANPALSQILGTQPGQNVSKSADEPPPYRVLRDGRDVPVEELPMHRAVADGHVVKDEELQILPHGWEQRNGLCPRSAPPQRGRLHRWRHRRLRRRDRPKADRGRA